MAAKIVKTLILLAFATLFSTSASAQYGTHAYCNGVWLPIGVQCGSGGGVVNNGGVFSQQPQCPAGSAWDGRGCLVNNNQQQQQQWQQNLANQAIRIPMGQQVPQGFCPLGDRFVNILKDMTFGAIVGGLVGDNRESARVGAGIGAVAGVFVPCNTLQQYQQVVVQQQQVQQAVVQQQNSGPVCVLPTRDRSDLTETECSQLGGVYKNGVNQQRVQQQMVLNHQVVERRTESLIIPTCKVISDEAIYRFNAVNGVKIDPRDCPRYVKGEIPLPSAVAMSIIP